MLPKDQGSGGLMGLCFPWVWHQIEDIDVVTYLVSGPWPRLALNLSKGT